jgi:uncharacterized protein YdaU (DUF1376 family)
MADKPNFAVHSYPWYIADWRESETRIDMTLEQRGLYRELLDACYREGSLPNDPRKLIALAGCTPREFSRSWPAVKPKFTESSDGRLENRRVTEVLVGLEHWHEQRRQAGRVSGLRRRTSVERPLDDRSTDAQQPFNGDGTSAEASSSTPAPTSAPAPTSTAALRPDADALEWTRNALGGYAAAAGLNWPAPDDAICERIYQAAGGDRAWMKTRLEDLWKVRGARPGKSWGWFISMLARGSDTRSDAGVVQ